MWRLPLEALDERPVGLGPVDAYKPGDALARDLRVDPNLEVVDADPDLLVGGGMPAEHNQEEVVVIPEDGDAQLVAVENRLTAFEVRHLGTGKDSGYVPPCFQERVRIDSPSRQAFQTLMVSAFILATWGLGLVFSSSRRRVEIGSSSVSPAVA